MNKKGFTLVELMAIIVLISIIALIGVTSVVGIRKMMDEKLFEEKLTSALSSAEKWGEDNKNELDKSITIGDLVVNGYYESEEGVNLSIYNGYVCGESKGDIKGYKDDELCKDVVTNNVDNIIINEMKIYVYIKNNRVYACIERNDDNKSFIKDFTKYSDDIYCEV